MLQPTSRCDRCGSDCGSTQSRLRVLDGPLGKYRRYVDLCGGCGADLARFLARGPDDAVAKPTAAAR